MNTSPSRLSIRTLGPVEIAVDDRPLDVDTKKAVALLVYLIGGRRSRDHLCDLLWPDAPPDRARAALRRTLSTLRSALGERWVEADRSTVWFVDDADVDVDVARFDELVDRRGDRQRAEIDDLHEATSLLRGQFLEGFALRGCPDFDDWSMRESQRIERRAITALGRLADGLVEEGRLDDALTAVTRWIDLDPLSEDAHRQAMLLHAWKGDRPAASRVYRTLVELLGRELGVDPLEETTELYEAILESDLPPVPTRKDPRPDPKLADPVPVFVGREDAIETILAVVDRGHGLVLVDGEVGVGKTRLLEEVSSRIPPDAVMVTGRAHRPESGVAYGPIQAALRDILRIERLATAVDAIPDASRAQVARLVPSLGRPAEDDPGDPTAKARFLDGIARAFGSLGATTVLAIDDLHWSDDATVELVSSMARRLDELGLVVVLTRRPEDTPAEHPVTMLVEDLTAIATVVRLDRLSIEDVTLLVERARITDLDPAVVYERTRGLPFFIVEYLSAARAGQAELPLAIRRLVLGRLGELGSIDRQIVTAMAVVGTACNVDTVRAVSGRSEDEVLGALDELLRRGILRESGEEIDFTHDQFREVAYAEASLGRRRLLHRRTAEHLMRLHEATRDPVAIANAAHHRLEAGDEREAAVLALSAGDLAAGVYANADALSQYETALALDPESSLPHLRIGEIRTRTGDYNQALVSFETARTRLRRGGRSEDAAAAAHAIGEIYRRLGKWELAAAAYAEALDGTGRDAFEAMIRSNWAYALHRSGQEAEAHTMAERARRSAEASKEPAAMAHAFNLSGLLADDPTTRRHHLDRALELTDEPRVRMAILNNLALTCADEGDPGAALEYGRAALAAAEVVGDVHRLAALHDNLADFHHQQGDEDAAMAELKEAVRLFARIDAEPGARVPEIWLLKEW